MGNGNPVSSCSHKIWIPKAKQLVQCSWLQMPKQGYPLFPQEFSDTQSAWLAELASCNWVDSAHFDMSYPLMKQTFTGTCDCPPSHGLVSKIMDNDYKLLSPFISFSLSSLCLPFPTYSSPSPPPILQLPLFIPFSFSPFIGYVFTVCTRVVLVRVVLLLWRDTVPSATFIEKH